MNCVMVLLLLTGVLMLIEVTVVCGEENEVTNAESLTTLAPNATAKPEYGNVFWEVLGTYFNNPKLLGYTLIFPLTGLVYGGSVIIYIGAKLVSWCRRPSSSIDEPKEKKKRRARPKPVAAPGVIPTVPTEIPTTASTSGAKPAGGTLTPLNKQPENLPRFTESVMGEYADEGNLDGHRDAFSALQAKHKKQPLPAIAPHEPQEDPLKAGKCGEALNDITDMKNMFGF